ncbi:MAG: hypothetical protein WD990_10910 [Acidimicrobiia bacterium]
MSYRSGWQRLGAAVSLMALLGLTLSTVGVASADEFTTTNTAPTVGTPSLSASIQPDAGASETEYTYSIVVGDAETLNDLDTVTVCLYLTTGGDSTCATPDPTTDVKLIWTQSTDAFTIDNGLSAYWALGTVTPSSSPTLTDTSGTFTFTFAVSEAAREGGWTAAVTADDGTTTDTDSTATTTVNHYSSITTRISQDFGALSAGLVNGSEITASPTLTANGQTTYNVTAGDFVGDGYTYTLKTDGLTSDAPAAGQVTFDCQVASTFTEASAVRVGSTSTAISSTETPTGTPEDGSTLANTCRLAHGGERPTGTYSFAVVTAVGNG